MSFSPKLSWPVLFAFLCYAGLYFHEPWRDELQAWLIAEEAVGWMDLVANHRYEGQPILWHFLMWLFQKIGGNFTIWQGLHAIIAIAAGWLILYRAPLPYLERGLVLFGYYFSYEYAVIVRPYGLSVLFFVLFLAEFCRASKRYWLLALYAILIANLHTFGVVMAGWLLMLLVTDAYREKVVEWKGYLSMAGIAGVGFFTALWFIWPEPNNGFTLGLNTHLQPWKVQEVFAGLFKGMIPIPENETHRFWNSHFLGALPRWVSALGGLVVLAGGVAFFRKDRWLLFGFLSGLGLFGIFFFVMFDYPFLRQYRHTGHFYLVFLGCYWLLCHRDVPRRWMEWSFRGILILHVVAMFSTLYTEIGHPFSNGMNVRWYLKDKQINTLPMLNTGDAELTTIAGLTNRRIYYLNRQEWGTFTFWKKTEPITPVERDQRIRLFMMEFERPLVLFCAVQPIMEWDSKDSDTGFEVELIGQFDVPNPTKEIFFLYLLTEQ